MHFLNQYSTGVCILYMAVERFILVCYPVKAKILLSDKARRVHAVIISVIVIFACSAAFYFEYFNATGDFYSFYPNNVYGSDLAICSLKIF